MKKHLFLIFTALIIFIQEAYSVTETISPELEQSLKVHSNEPSVSSILFALLVVILLIYATGIIYSKLNIVGAKAIRDQLKNYDLSKAIVLSTTQLGPNKNLHVIELSGKKYLIGATPNSINLIKELDATHEAKEAEESKEPADENPIDVLYDSEEEPSLQLTLGPPEEFDIHKKYL